jgi:hypothetical protein
MRSVYFAARLRAIYPKTFLTSLYPMWHALLLLNLSRILRARNSVEMLSWNLLNALNTLSAISYASVLNAT